MRGGGLSTVVNCDRPWGAMATGQGLGGPGGPRVRSPCGCVVGLQISMPSSSFLGPGAWRMVPRGAQGGLPGED